MRGERAFLEHDSLQPPPIIFEQFGWAQIARHQHGIAPEPLSRRGADLARDDAKQAVRQILEIVHPVRQKRIVDFAHPHPRALLHPFDRGFGGQAGIDRFVDSAAPPFVVGEHAIGLEHLDMLAALAEFGLLAHRVDLVAHLVESAVDALALCLGIVGDDLGDLDARLVEHRVAPAKPLHQREPFDDLGTGIDLSKQQRVFFVHHLGIRDQLGQDHRGGLQGLDLDIFVAARIDMLDAQRAHRALAMDDGNAGKAVEFFFARFGAIEEVGMRLRLGEVKRLDIRRDDSVQTFAEAQFGDVDGFGIEAARGVELEHAFAQEIDRTDLAIEAFADDLDHLVELALRVHARGHHLVQAGQDLAGAGGGGHDLLL